MVTGMEIMDESSSDRDDVVSDNSHNDRQPSDASEFDDVESEFSLSDLSKAYAKIISDQRGDLDGTDDDAANDVQISPDDDSQLEELDDAKDNLAAPIDEFSIVEAILFVGAGEGEKLTPRKIAASMRDISPKEIKKIVETLNERYQRDGNPYRIQFESGGYQMVLAPHLEGVRSGFYGEVREAELNRHAVEVLSVVAYRQPVSRDEIEQIRQKPCGSLLRQLQSRNLLALDENDPDEKTKKYVTGPRFLELLGLESLDDLPMAHEVDDIDEFFSDSS